MDLFNSVKKHALLLKVNVAALTSFVGLSSSNLVYAAGDADAFKSAIHVEGSKGASTLTELFSGFIAPLQGFAAVLLVLFAIILGIKIGAAAVTSDPRGREGAIVGLFFIILAGVVVIHAKEIVGMSAGITGA